MAIRAPYNFVPLSDKVFFPDWADQISQDVPFEDGVSGCIDIEITAETPIFVRNGHSRAEGEKKDGDYRSFSQAPDSRYFIPSTSIKGCIRNVLEILSFGKMRVDNSAKFAQREWNNKELYPLKDATIQSDMCCGWLCRRGDNYIIRKCAGTYKRIAMSRIDEWIRSDVFEKHFSADFHFDLNKPTKLSDKEYDPKTASYKYALLQEQGINRNKLKGLHFEGDDFYDKRGKGVVVNASGRFVGTIVLTGSPDKAKNWNKERNINDGKYFEFVFPDKIEREIELSKEDFDNYKFIYADSADWKEWQNELDKDGMPVFFRYEQKKVVDFGLALLYRLPYSRSVIEIEKKRYSKEDRTMDLPDCIFGTESKDDALKGRVFFSNCFSSNAQEDKQFTLILNGPKASYYPIYIEQPTAKNGIVAKYETYNDGNLSGWKRYHLRSDVWCKNMNNPKLDTDIFPLKSGSVFNGSIKFHNLKVEELGALLSALTFHSNSNSCRHQIGQAKPYGFGKITLNISKIYFDKEGLTPEYAMAMFEYKMNNHLGSKWILDSSIVQLMTLAHESVPNTPQYEYMTLDVDSRKNEFVDCKGGVKGNLPKQHLQRFSEMRGFRFIIKSLSEPIENEINERIRIAEELKVQQELEQIQKDIATFKTNINDFIDAKNCSAAEDENSKLKVYLNEHKKDTSICDEYRIKIENLKALKSKQDAEIGNVINSLKFGTVDSMIKKWMSAKAKSELSEQDKIDAKKKLKQKYGESNSKDKKDFDKNRKRFEDLFGPLDF